MKNIALFILSIVIPITNYAQTYQIIGKVVDKEEFPLVGATVYLTELNKGTSTDENGVFTIQNLKKGVYNIQVSYIGYQSKIKNIKLHENNQKIILSLEKIDISINEVTISDSYPNTQDKNTTTIDVVKKSDFQKYGAFTIMDVINRIPGIDAVTTGPMVTRPVIRGLSSNRVLTVADGNRFETQQWDDEHGIGVNELGIDRIEIIKGPSALLYGAESMGGVINLIDEKPALIGTTEGSIKSSLFSNNLGMLTDFNLKGAKEKYNWGVNVLGKLFSDYFYNGYDFRVPNTRLLEVGAKGYFGINRNWGATKISYLFNDAYYGILDAKDVIKKPDGSIVNIDTLEKAKFPLEIEAPFHSVIDNRVSSKTTLLHGSSKTEFIFGYQNNHRVENEEALGKKRGEKYLDLTLNTATYNIKHYLPNIKKLSVIVGSQGMYQKNKNGKDTQTQLIPDATIKDIGFFLVSTIPYKNFKFSAGVRYDARFLDTKQTIIDSTVNLIGIEKDYSNWNSSWGLSYNFQEKLLLRTSFASSYRSPNLNELASNGTKLESLRFEIGNPNFKKEQIFQWDANLTLKLKQFDFSVSGFINTISNFIYIAPTGNIVASKIQKTPFVSEYVFLQDDVSIKGLEAFLLIYPTSTKLLSYEVKASTLTARKYNDDSYLPMMPTNKIFNTFIINVGEFKKLQSFYTRIGTTTALKQFKVAENEKKTPSYTLLNVGFGAELNTFEFNFIINNALDRKYLDNMSRFRAFDIYSPGINISFSVKKYFKLKEKKLG